MGSSFCPPPPHTHTLHVFHWQEVERLSAGEDPSAPSTAPPHPAGSDTQRAVDVAELRAYMHVQKKGPPLVLKVRVVPTFFEPEFATALHKSVVCGRVILSFWWPSVGTTTFHSGCR